MASPSLRRGSSRRWHVAVLAALLALVWQSLVVQTHSHPARPATAPMFAQASPAAQAVQARGDASDDPLDCPVCRQIAQAGHYLSPDPITLVVAWGSALVPLVPACRRWFGRARSHAWYGRGPPASPPSPTA